MIQATSNSAQASLLANVQSVIVGKDRDVSSVQVSVYHAQYNPVVYVVHASLFKLMQAYMSVDKAIQWLLMVY